MVMEQQKILFVDDEPNILAALQRCLFEDDYDVHTATSGQSGIDMAIDHNFALIVSDHRMPEMTGIEFLTQVKRICPDATRVLLTGYADMNAAIDAINHGEVHRFLSKPWDDHDLRRVIAQAVERFVLIDENKRLHELTSAQNEKLQQWNEKLEEGIKERTAELTQALERVKAGFANSITIFSGLLEAYNQKLGCHSFRVAESSRSMAVKAGFGPEYSQIVAVAAQLHDIGRIGIQKAIISAQEQDLSPQDRQILRRHPTAGEELVNFGEHFEKVGRLIRSHHENFDGSGYPDGLCGNDIPKGARVIAIASAYDHAYEDSGADTAAALESIKTGSGCLYDPELVQILVECTQEVAAQGGLERQIDVSALMPGMILSRDIKSAGGQILLSRGRLLGSFDISRLKNFNRIWGVAPIAYVVG